MTTQHRCPAPRCPHLIPTTTRYCPTHARDYETRRGTTTQRGYTHTHTHTRKTWTTRITNGEPIHCPTCGTRITNTKPWDLGHDHTNGGYLGPQCASCNRSEGGKRGRETQTRNAQTDN